MQTSEQVAGEAREKLASEQQKLLDALSYFRPHWATSGPVMLTPDKMREHLAVIEATLRDMANAALRAQPERGVEEMRERAARCAETVEAWCEYVNIGETSTDGIAKAIRALPLHPAKDEGGGR